jgi:hypothetical protein
MPKPKNKITSLGTVGTFLKAGACSETIFKVLDNAFINQLKPEEHASVPFAGGIMQHGYQCGMIWGAVLSAGAEIFRQLGNGHNAEAMSVIVAQKLVNSFNNQNGNINCMEITDLDKSSTTMQMITYFLLKGGTIGCMRMAAKYAPVAFDVINTTLSEKHDDIPPAPVSCAAILAQKMGASNMQTVMAAGLAGGIGLCGGACGALGAAIWIHGMRRISEGAKIDYKSPETAKIIEKFLKSSDYRFECSEITGRKFENVADHAAFLSKGGCKEILDELAM